MAAGWTLNCGQMWLLAAAGCYDNLSRKRVRVYASLIQTLLGFIALGLAIGNGVASGELYGGAYEVRAHWQGAIFMLMTSVILTLLATLLALWSPERATHRAESRTQGWTGMDESERKLALSVDAMDKKGIFRVSPKYCGDLGLVGLFDLCCGCILFIFWFVIAFSAWNFRIREPYASCFAVLPFKPGTFEITESLDGNSQTIGGIYKLTLDREHISVTNVVSEKSVFQSLAGEPFIRAAYGPFQARNDYQMGTFDIVDVNADVSRSQTIDTIDTDGSTFIQYRGVLGFGEQRNLKYNLTFTVPSATRHLKFNVAIDDAALKKLMLRPALLRSAETKLYWVHDSNQDEKFYGFGQSFSYYNLKSACMPIITREQGIGRGMQPFTYFINNFAHNGAGSWQTTYSAVPHYITSTGRSMFLEDSEFIVYDMSRPDRLAIEIVKPSMTGRFLSEASYLDTIEQYTLYSGRMRALPEWVGRGAVIGLQGGKQTVMRQIQQLEANGVPLTGVWLRDWSGKRETVIGDRLLWNWQPDESFYPGWHDMIVDLRDNHNISMLTYINPYLADKAPDAQGRAVAQPMFLEAKSKNCLIRNAKNKTLIQISTTSDFTFATVDLTSPVCMDWYVDVIRSNMLNISAVEAGKPYGALGWMADFAETIPFDAVLASGENAAAVHNRFPKLWAETCRKAINISAGGFNFSQEAAFFTRSSFSTTPGASTLMWLGDQMQHFNKYDGLETVIPATASQGLSGFALSHTDVGGYLGFSVAGGSIQVVRTKEVLWRWMEMNAFIDAMFRSHEGNLPRSSFQVTQDVETMRQFGRFATIFKALHPYRRTLMMQAESKGYPIARHPMLHYSDPALQTMQDQIMLGEELMFCPATRYGITSVSCYLPAGSGVWVEFFDSTKTHDAGTAGTTINCPAPLGRPCALFKQGAVNIIAARATLETQGFVF